MHRIIPAIIPESERHLRDSLELVRFAPTVQIDVVDGHFAGPPSWPYLDGGAVSRIKEALEGFDVMVDLMVEDVFAAAHDWLEVGAQMIVVHLESVDSLAPICALKSQYNFALYISADDETALETYLEYTEVIDGIQLMGIDEIGKQGQPFSPRVLDTTRALRERLPQLPIVIDGAVSPETAPGLLEAGATDLVVGSAIMKTDNPRAAYKELCKLAR